MGVEVQPIDTNRLAENRDKLVAWQRQKWYRETPGLRLHLGSGHIHLEGYVNVDPYTEESDCKDDMRHLSFEPGSVSEIVSHHALEHIPLRTVWPTLKHWFDLLAPGGTLEIGLPDAELCFQSFLEASERTKWNRYIWTIYGGQTEADAFLAQNEWSPRDGLEYCPGQVHMGGFSLGYFVRMLEDIGFRMVDAFNYDGYGTPSLFAFAIKPEDTNPPDSLLEQNTVIGTFTNRTHYLPALWASARTHLPRVPFITRIQRGPINTGMSLLREDFIASGKRYWCFLDDDIQFLNPDILRNALRTLIDGKYGAVSVYSTFDPESIAAPYDPVGKGLIARPHKWATGYFILVDSEKVGHIIPDMDLPEPNTAVDTSYSVAIRAAGYEIGISPDYVYHNKKTVFADMEMVKRVNEYLLKKWGQFYFDWAQYDSNVIEWGI
jgi:hypothetical protein